MHNPPETSAFAARLERLASLPRRNAALHWAAFVASLVSLSLLAVWMASGKPPVPGVWAVLDIALGIAFALEFFTRSGFRWHPTRYVATRFFDFLAMAPPLALVHHGFPLEGVWVWIILIARGIRVLDRLLGDGFAERNAFAIAEGFEEALTDRVMLRILARTEADLERVTIGRAVGEALAKNRDSVLQRVHAAQPTQGLTGALAHLVGLEHIEERTYDSIVEIISGPEVDRAIRDVVNSAFTEVRREMATKSWRKRLGIQRLGQDQGQGPPLSGGPA